MDMTVYLVLAAVLLAAGSWLVFIWAARSGQFTDVESAARRAFEIEREPEPTKQGGDGNE